MSFKINSLVDISTIFKTLIFVGWPKEVNAISTFRLSQRKSTLDVQGSSSEVRLKFMRREFVRTA